MTYQEFHRSKLPHLPSGGNHMPYSAPYQQVRATTEIIAIADACLGGLRGRSALLIGPAEQRHPYSILLQQAGMKYIYQEDTPAHVFPTLPHIQLLISIPAPAPDLSPTHTVPLLTAATIAKGCIGRRTPLLIFDLAETPSSSVEELAGLLPAVCLYTPADLRHILAKVGITSS